MKHTRGSFTSQFGFLMAVAGSAVGLGNIWRFPYMMGENGGAAFLLLYLVLIILVGMPLILSEFSIGKATMKGPVGAFRKLAPKSRWSLLGYSSVITALVILGFYAVIAGWTIYFLIDALDGGFEYVTGDDVQANFTGFVNSGSKPIMYAMIFIAIVVFIVLRGVEKGIEKYNKVLMPLLFVILLVMCVYSFTMDGFVEGMKFIFQPDFSEITGATFLDALGQVFFSLSLGMGTMITYSSYSSGDENMFTSKLKVAIIDTSIAILAGIAIFPAVFTYGISPSEGPSLVFLTLPTVFAQMEYGAIFGSLFFVLLLIAAVTSAISLFEVIVVFFVEQFKKTRKKALMITVPMVVVLALLSALSQVEGSSLMVLGYNFFDFLDVLSSNYLMTLTGLAIAIFTGWYFDKKKLHSVFTSKGKYANAIFKPFFFSIRYIAPVAVALVILSRIGII